MFYSTGTLVRVRMSQGFLDFKIVFSFRCSFLLRGSERLHEKHRATPVDPGHVWVLGQNLQLVRRKRHIDYVVELAKIMVQGLADGEDGGTSGLVVVLYVCLRYSVVFLSPMGRRWLLGGDDGRSVGGNSSS